VVAQLWIVEGLAEGGGGSQEEGLHFTWDRLAATITRVVGINV